MAQGPWDTGTWNDAFWDSLPITGNSATGSPGSVGIGERTVALTGNEATAAVGTVTPSAAIDITGVQATGAVGTEGDSLTIALTGIEATGSVGTVSHGGISFDLTGVEATGAAGNVIYVPTPVIVVDDTHDGDHRKKQKKRFDKENQRLKQKRKDIVAAYERIVEGKPDIADEIAKPFIVTDLKKTENGKPKIDYDKMFADLNRIERIWAEYLEMDDEDMLVLL